jgi:hypothetical protein
MPQAAGASFATLDFSLPAMIFASCVLLGRCQLNQGQEHVTRAVVEWRPTIREPSVSFVRPDSFLPTTVNANGVRLVRSAQTLELANVTLVEWVRSHLSTASAVSYALLASSPRTMDFASAALLGHMRLHPVRPSV